MPELTSIQLGDDAFCYKGDDSLSEFVMRSGFQFVQLIVRLAEAYVHHDGRRKQLVPP